jgi:hypothetical protein
VLGGKLLSGIIIAIAQLVDAPAVRLFVYCLGLGRSPLVMMLVTAAGHEANKLNASPSIAPVFCGSHSKQSTEHCRHMGMA